MIRYQMTRGYLLQAMQSLWRRNRNPDYLAEDIAREWRPMEAALMRMMEVML